MERSLVTATVPAARTMAALIPRLISRSESLSSSSPFGSSCGSKVSLFFTSIASLSSVIDLTTIKLLRSVILCFWVFKRFSLRDWVWVLIDWGNFTERIMVVVVEQHRDAMGFVLRKSRSQFNSSRWFCRNKSADFGDQTRLYCDTDRTGVWLR